MRRSGMLVGKFEFNSLGSQLIQQYEWNMSGKNLIRHNPSSVYVSCLCFLSRPKNRLTINRLSRRFEKSL